MHPEREEIVMKRRCILLARAAAAIAAAGMLLTGCGTARAGGGPAPQTGPLPGPAVTPSAAVTAAPETASPAPPLPSAAEPPEGDGPPAGAPSPSPETAGPGQTPGANPLAGSADRPRETVGQTASPRDPDPAVSVPPAATTGDYAIVTGSSGIFAPGAMVSDSWFDDALFIGDSRTDGLRLYARAGKADYFVSTGLSVYTALTKTASDRNFSNCTLRSLLDSRTYGKILICLGLNECGTRLENIISSYQSLIYTVRQKQPGAVILLQGVMACGRGKAAANACFGPANINRLNANIRKMAAAAGCYYIDPNTLFADGEGYLPDYLSGDGCHFRPAYYKTWLNWIKCQVYGIPVGPGVSPAPTPEPTPTPIPAPEPTPSPAPETAPPPASEAAAEATPEPTIPPAPETVPTPAPEETAEPAPEEILPPPGPETTAAPAGTGADTEEDAE